MCRSLAHAVVLERMPSVLVRSTPRCYVAIESEQWGTGGHRWASTQCCSRTWRSSARHASARGDAALAYQSICGWALWSVAPSSSSGTATPCTSRLTGSTSRCSCSEGSPNTSMVRRWNGRHHRDGYARILDRGPRRDFFNFYSYVVRQLELLGLLHCLRALHEVYEIDVNEGLVMLALCSATTSRRRSRSPERARTIGRR